jgi:hypothetical protein
MGDAYLAFTAVQIVWIGFSVLWAIRRHDELPLIASVFLCYIFSFRFWAILQGWANPVNLGHFGFDDPTFLTLIEAHGLGVLGQSAFLAAYMVVQKHQVVVSQVTLRSDVLRRIRTVVFVLISLCLPVALLARASVAAQAAAGRSTAFEVTSYLSLFPLALVGTVVLLAALLRARAFAGLFSATSAILSLLAIAVVTFQPSLRFQFLGWVVAVTVIFSSGKSIARKAWIVTCGLVVAVCAFAVAGALRNADDPEALLQENAWERFAFAQDANMLDGFVLLRQVYPDMLDYSYGGEHLEILQRPIPRKLWPNKPVGGYMNKLGIIDIYTGFTLGISPSLFGSFYQEGAIFGLILLSALYGYAFARLVRFSATVEPFTGLVIRGCACAALIPLLRGGDLPGIYAWFGMSFWPVALVLWIYRRELFYRPHTAQSAVPQAVSATG